MCWFSGITVKWADRLLLVNDSGQLSEANASLKWAATAAAGAVYLTVEIVRAIFSQCLID